MKPDFKGNLLLLLAAIVVSIVSWIFWRYAGEFGFTILLSLAVIGFGIDNRRLRRELRKR